MRPGVDGLHLRSCARNQHSGGRALTLVVDACVQQLRGRGAALARKHRLKLAAMSSVLAAAAQHFVSEKQVHLGSGCLRHLLCERDAPLATGPRQSVQVEEHVIASAQIRERRRSDDRKIEL